MLDLTVRSVSCIFRKDLHAKAYGSSSPRYKGTARENATEVRLAHHTQSDIIGISERGVRSISKWNYDSRDTSARCGYPQIREPRVPYQSEMIPQAGCKCGAYCSGLPKISPK